VPSNGTVVKIFTHPENDLDGEFYVHVRYDMDLMINKKCEIGPRKASGPVFIKPLKLRFS
jgi:hypothetical protein